MQLFGELGLYRAYNQGALAGLTLTAKRAQPPTGEAATGVVRAALRALARRDVLRNLLLLEVSDLMLDVLTGYLALYFVDVLGEPAWVGALLKSQRAGGIVHKFRLNDLAAGKCDVGRIKVFHGSRLVTACQQNEEKESDATHELEW